MCIGYFTSKNIMYNILMNKKATFGAGCFWGVEDMFRQMPGVVNTTAGYMGGSKENPTYEEVCSHTTGHAEVVEVEYDPEKIAYTTLLDAFWRSHDPTTPNKQGPDMGSQYRSIIFYYDEEQHNEAVESMKQQGATGKYQDIIVTAIIPAMKFWPAEEYHQQYFSKKGMSRTCHT